MSEREQNPESELELLKESVDRGVTLALEEVRERFEDAADVRDRLPFHNVDHTEGVIRRTVTILQTLREIDPERVSEREVELGRLTGGFHDTVQTWSTQEIPDGEAIKVMRRRNVGTNEQASGAEARKFMKSENERLGSEMYSEADQDLVVSSIDGTVPAYDGKRGTAIQPNVSSTSPVLAKAVALADLGIAGMEGPEKYALTGDALFREENIDILIALHEGQPVSDDDRERFRRRMLSWTGSQSGFVKGRQQAFAEEINSFSEVEQKALRLLFRHFDETSTAAEALSQRRQAMSFEELARDMGYSL